MRLFAAILLLTLLAGSAWAEINVEMREGVAYGPDPAEVMDVCVPPSAPRPHPGLVLIHGGGWHGGRRLGMSGWCREFARRGIVTINIDYRLAGKPGGEWPAQLEDVQLAVRWLRANAAELGLDPARICAAGDSAGGHLAVFLAVLRHTMPGDRAGVLPGVSSAVACAADNFGPVDFTVPSRFLNALPLLAGSPDPGRQAAVGRDASPLPLVSPMTAPIMIAQGDADDDVAPSQSDLLRAALARAHVRTIYLSYPGKHQFKGLSGEETQAIMNLEAAFIRSAPATAP